MKAIREALDFFERHTDTDCQSREAAVEARRLWDAAVVELRRLEAGEGPSPCAVRGCPDSQHVSVSAYCEGHTEVLASAPERAWNLCSSPGCANVTHGRLCKVHAEEAK